MCCLCPVDRHLLCLLGSGRGVGELGGRKREETKSPTCPEKALRTHCWAQNSPFPYVQYLRKLPKRITLESSQLPLSPFPDQILPSGFSCCVLSACILADSNLGERLSESLCPGAHTCHQHSAFGVLNGDPARGCGAEQLEPLVTLATQLAVSHPDWDFHTFPSQHQARQANSAATKASWTMGLCIPLPGQKTGQLFFSQLTEDKDGEGGL